MFRFLILVGMLLLAGCTNNGTPERFLTKYADPDPSLEAVLICHGYGCHRQDNVDLRLAWPRLVANMAQPAPDAAAERANIALTIAAFEAEVGARIGTDEDVGGTFEGFAMAGQLDCIDETSNTSTFLTLLDEAGLLVWHDVRGPTSRFFVYDGWPHTTAVIVETASGQAYAVDSWFHDNGQPAEIVPIEDWKAGWGPEDGFMVATVEESDAGEADTSSPDVTIEVPIDDAVSPPGEDDAVSPPGETEPEIAMQAAIEEQSVQTYQLLSPRGPDPARPPRPRP